LRRETTIEIAAVIIMAATMTVGVDTTVVIAGTAAMVVATFVEIMDTGTIAVMVAGVVADMTVAGVVAAKHEDMVVTNLVYLYYALDYRR
jgi:hypothetical protein